MYRDSRDDWLSKLGRSMHLPQMEFDDEGLCQFTLNDELIVTLRKVSDNDGLVLFGQIPIEPISPAVMQKMLVENRNSAKYAAPVLSIAESLDAIEVHFKLSQKELYETDDVLEQLVGNLEYWRDCAAA